MVKEIDLWMKLLIEKLLRNFQNRVIFVGLQGSYHRGEATEKSDIDVVLILDFILIEDLKKYKEIICTMPEYEKACGFTCGLKEFTFWAKQDLFQLFYDTSSYYGDFEALIGIFDKEDIISAIKMGVGNIYHEVCHRFLFKDNHVEQAEKLKTAYKTTFYILQACLFLGTGRYISTRNELTDYLDNADKTIMNTYDNWDSLIDDRVNRPDFYFSQLLDWCKIKLVSFAA